MKFIKNMNFDFVEFLSFNERPFRARLLPSKIYHDLDKLKNKSRELKNYFKKFRTSIVFKKEDREDELISISGEAEWGEEKPRAFINVHTDHFDTFKFSRYSWMQFKYVFVSIFLHEVIHMMQFLNRGSESSGSARFIKSGIEKKDDQRSYHADKDEIQCHAFQVWLDYKVSRTNKPIPELVKSCLKRNYSSHLASILKIFDFDFDNSALRQLCKEIIRWEDRYCKFILTSC